MARRAALVCYAAVFSCVAQVGGALEVTFSGSADENLAVELQGGSLLYELSQSEEATAPQEIVSNAQADYRRLLAILYDRGFFGPSIQIKLDGREASGILAVAPPAQVSQASILVDPGRKFTFGSVQVTPVTSDTQLPDGFASGQTAGVSVLQTATQRAIAGWRDAGHAKADVQSQQITARHANATLDAQIILAPGPQLRFGPLTQEGTSAVRRDRILEIAGLPEGAVFSPDEMEKATARLRRTGAFRSVSLVEDEQIGPQNTLPITARVTDEKPRRFGFGGEISTLEGLTLSGFWLHRNIFGGAERLRFDAEISGIGGDTGGIDYLLGVRFERPATFNEDTNFFALAELEQLDQVGFFSRQVTLGVGIERIASDERRYTFGLGVRRAQTEDALGEDDYTLFLTPASATFDYRDDALDARRGYYSDVRLTPFLAIAGADNGLLTKVDVRGYRTFGGARPTTLALRAQLGSVVGPSLDDAPADFLFYSGGGGTVRGHDFQSLGVDVGASEEIGGRSFLGLSAELRLRSSGALGYVGFIDAGYIGSESFPDGSGEWHSGAGVGLRYATAIGPIRVDLAVPTSGDNDASDFQIYIGIGHSF